jgi:hypothetical protein
MADVEMKDADSSTPSTTKTTEENKQPTEEELNAQLIAGLNVLFIS